MEMMVCVWLFNGYFQVVWWFGFNLQEVLWQVGLDLVRLIDLEQLVFVVVMCQLMEIIVVSVLCLMLGLQMVEVCQELDFGVFGLLLVYKCMLCEVLQVIIQYCYLLNEVLVIYLEFDGDMVVICEEVIIEMLVLLWQVNELVVGVLVWMCSVLLGVYWKLCSIYFLYVVFSDVSLYWCVFGCFIVFGSDFNGIVCLVVDLDRFNFVVDLVFVCYVESFVELFNVLVQEVVVQDVCCVIYLLLLLECVFVEQVVDYFYLSVWIL